MKLKHYTGLLKPNELESLIGVMSWHDLARKVAGKNMELAVFALPMEAGKINLQHVFSDFVLIEKIDKLISEHLKNKAQQTTPTPTSKN